MTHQTASLHIQFRAWLSRKQDAGAPRDLIHHGNIIAGWLNVIENSPPSSMPLSAVTEAIGEINAILAQRAVTPV